MSRLFRRALLGVCLLLGLTAGGLVVLATVYEDEVKARLLGALNEQLTAPVKVGQVDLTLIRRFPKAGLRLQNVLAMEDRADSLPADTLLYARDLYLEFSLWDLYRGDYTIDRIHGVDVRAYPAHDPTGRPNYRIWGKDTIASQQEALALRQVTFDELYVRYTHGASGVVVTGASDHLRLRGTLGSPSELHVDGHIHLVDWAQGTDHLLADREAEVLLTMTFGAEDEAFRIINGEVNAGGVRLTTTLAVVPEADGIFLDLRAASDQADVNKLLALLPSAVKRPLAPYALKGEADVVVRYSGTIGGELPPTLALQLAVRDGRMKEQYSGATFTHIQGWADLTLAASGALSALTIKEFRARSGSGNVSGGIQLRGGKNAHVKGSMNVRMDLADLLHFIRLDSLEQAQGQLAADLHVAGKLPRLHDLTAKDFKHLETSGSLTLHNAALKLKGLNASITGMDAELALDGNDARVRSLSADLQGERISLQGTLHQLVPYLLLDDQRLSIEANGSAARLDLARWLDRTSTAKSGDRALVLPAWLTLDLEMSLGELVLDDFSATDITGHVTLQDRVLSASHVRFATASGQVQGSMRLDGRSATAYPLSIQASLQGMDIAQLFAEFKDFGQDFIGHQHLQGTGRAELDFHAPLSPALAFDLDRLTCTADIVIDNGALKGHAPLMEVAAYMKQKKLAGLLIDTDQLAKRLADVRFATLSNHIEIRDRQVFIPLMEVKSTALDIELSGTHSFDDRIDHRLNFRLGDLLRSGEREDAGGAVADDGTGPRLFLRMQGSASDPQFSTDAEMAALRRSRQWKQEKEELKALFKEGSAQKGAHDERTVSAAPGSIHFEVEQDDAPEKEPARPKKDRDGTPPPVIIVVEED
ncbi:MAG: hypothetical protein IPH53_13615 [Flavobacteriales bacterium]|nr:hypothetical protein [Flavobacteriales bacterium]